MLELIPSPIVACTVCGGAVDDLIIVLGSSVGLTGLAIGFESAFVRASKALGWQWAQPDATEDTVAEDTEQPAAEAPAR